MKNSILLILVSIFTLQLGFSTNPITTHKNEFKDASYDLKSNNEGFIDKLTAKINIVIVKAKKKVKEAITFIKKKAADSGLGLWTLLTLGIGILATIVGLVLLFAGIGTGSGGAFLFGYILLYGGILLVSAGLTLGVIWLIVEVA